MSISDFCCLCLAPAPADHRRRKYFNANSCSNARGVIKSLSDEEYLELNDPSALLCNGCERKAINISNMSEKLERLKVEVKSSLSRLHVDSSSRKRPSLPLDMPSDLEPAPK